MPYLWMLLSAVAFALMTSCGFAARESFHWQVIALARAGLALLFSFLLTRATGTPLAFWRPRSLWLRSIVGSISLLCSFYAMTRMPVADFLTLTHMYPIWVGLLSWPMLGERPGSDVWLAVASGLAGVVLIQQPGSINPDHYDWTGYLVAAIASFTSAVSVLGLHRIRGVDPRAIVVHFSAVSLVFVSVAICLSLWNDGPQSAAWIHHDGIVDWGLLCGVGGSATIGQVFLTRAYSSGSPARVAVVGLSQVAFGMLADALFFDRQFAPLTLAGIGLIMAPTLWLVLRRRPATHSISQGEEVDELLENPEV